MTKNKTIFRRPAKSDLPWYPTHSRAWCEVSGDRPLVSEDVVKNHPSHKSLERAVTVDFSVPPRLGDILSRIYWTTTLKIQT